MLLRCCSGIRYSQIKTIRNLYTNDLSLIIPTQRYDRCKKYVKKWSLLTLVSFFAGESDYLRKARWVSDGSLVCREDFQYFYGFYVN